MIIFDETSCRGCGVCSAECPSDLITVRERKPYLDSTEECRQCFHCVTTCPVGAIGIPEERFTTVPADTPFLSRRSCRSYRQDPIDRSILSSLAIGADLAPRMSPPGTRRFVFVMNPDKLAEIRNALSPRIHLAHRLLRALAVLMVFTPRVRLSVKRTLRSLALTAANLRSGGDLFYGAPALVLVIGNRTDRRFRDDGIYAMQQLLLSAESEGIGSCINGFVSRFSKASVRALGLPSDVEIWAAAVLGHPKLRPERAVLRKDLAIRWI